MMSEEMTNLEQTTASDQTEPVTEVIQVIEIVELDRSLMTTSFENYTVTEGLLLLLLLFLFVKEFILKPLKGGFSWLFWWLVSLRSLVWMLSRLRISLN